MFCKILDNTLRDGGYYSQWDFDKFIVDEYIKATNALPIEYIEVGYRNNPSKDYIGKYGYCPISELTDIRNKSTQKIAVMVDEKNVTSADLANLIDPIKSLINMVRIAVNPQNFERSIVLAENIKNRGLQVSLNVMYMSKWKEYNGFFDILARINDIVDVFYMVDSYGSISPKELKSILLIVKEHLVCKIGFHGHNNLEMGLINALTAIDNGVSYIDTTILGIGRGAGNLKLELLLTYLNKHYELDVNFNALGDAIIAFIDLLDKYKWGTNLPFMLSGVNSFPQEDVMNWINTRAYSFNSIVHILDNRRQM
jgi:4-hydroxy 2-oxovalerate aldolase